jgi:hypothetical protein
MAGSKEYDLFGNEIIDTRTETQKKIDALWDTYCELFDTCISWDMFAISDNDILKHMEDSIRDKVDYLKDYIIFDNYKDGCEY